MICDLCGQNPAAFLVGNTETGDQTYMCLPDFARTGLEVAKVQLPQGEILDALGIVSASEAETEAAVKGRKRKGPKPAEAEPEPPAGPETPEGVEETAAAATDGGA